MPRQSSAFEGASSPRMPEETSATLRSVEAMVRSGESDPDAVIHSLTQLASLPGITDGKKVDVAHSRALEHAFQKLCETVLPRLRSSEQLSRFVESLFELSKRATAGAFSPARGVKDIVLKRANEIVGGEIDAAIRTPDAQALLNIWDSRHVLAKVDFRFTDTQTKQVFGSIATNPSVPPERLIRLLRAAHSTDDAREADPIFAHPFPGGLHAVLERRIIGETLETAIVARLKREAQNR